MRKRALKYIYIAAILIPAILFVAKFGGAPILRLYLETGVGSCRKIPILCLTPEEEIVQPGINKEYSAGLLTIKLEKVEIAVPRGFNVVQEAVKKVYYKKMKGHYSGAVIYLLYEPPDFFIDLFPRLKKQGITDNYKFVRRVMYARLKDTENLTDAFFVIMKGIFTPDLGSQDNVRMAQFKVADKKGFINYNLGKADNYFDCNVIDDEGGFFKIYIKDKAATLNLDNVMAIVSTAKILQ